MTNRENQKRLDKLAMRYLAAIDAGDFDTLADLWVRASDDPDLCELLHGLNATLAEEDSQAAGDAVVARIEQHMRSAEIIKVVARIEQHMRSAEIIKPTEGPLTVAEVADHLRKHPPPGLTIDELALNDALRRAAEVVPGDLGLSRVVEWGTRFGTAPEAYWRAFRQAALKLRMRQESAASYQMAARPTKPKPPEGKS
jgi:hypothetical protein